MFPVAFRVLSQVSAARAVLEERTRELERALAEVEALRAGGAAASAASLGRAADAVGAHVAAGAPLAAEAASLRARVRELEVSGTCEPDSGP